MNPMRAQRGFTLIELMITVAIVAILASVAYASYQSSVIKTRRGKAAACLVEQAQWMERYYTTNFTYNSATYPSSSCDASVPYGFAFVGAPNATSFTLKATPTGAQLKDTKCGSLTLDQTGAKNKTGTGTVAECW